MNAQCIAVCHASTECKTAGQVCEEGICLAPACGGDSECTGAGQACINGKCAAAPAASQVDHCNITPSPADVNQGSSTQLSVIAKDAGDKPLHFSQFTWAATGPATIDQTGLVKGTGKGDITVTATVGAPPATGAKSCTAIVHGYATVASGSLRVTVINMHSKEPVVGAKIVLDTAPTPQLSGADGSYTFTGITGSHDIHVFAEGYNFTSFIGVTTSASAATDLLVPIQAYVKLVRRNGFQGRMTETCPPATSADPLSAVCEPFTPLQSQGEAVHLAFFGSAIPNSLLDLSVDTLLGPLHSVTVNLGSSKTLNLPRGLVLGVGSNMFGTSDYALYSDAGKRALWGIGGNVNLSSAVSALGPLLQGSSSSPDVGALLPQLLPLFSKLQAGAVTGVEAPPPVADGQTGTTKPIDIPLTTPLRLRMAPVSPDLPKLDGKYVDGVVVVAGAMAYPQGFIPLGLTAALSAKDANKANTAKVLDPTCDASTNPAACATSKLPFKLAPANGGAEGSKYGLALLALNFGGIAPGSTGQVAVSGIVSTMDAVKYTTPDQPAPAPTLPAYLNLPATSSVTVARTGRQISIGANADPKVQIYRFEIESHARLTWNLWMNPATIIAAGAPTLPDPSKYGVIDPFKDATADDGTIAGPTARLLGLQFTDSSLTPARLESFGGLTLDQIGTNLAAFTALQIPVNP
jgi:hypothetical protein